MLTSAQIEAAKRRLNLPNGHHEHDDSIRIAYEWLDAQKKLDGSGRYIGPLKHLIENWGGRYVSQSDVEVAAFLHPEIRGRYPSFNLSKRLTEPSTKRLSGIAQALTQGYRENHDVEDYKIQE